MQEPRPVGAGTSVATERPAVVGGDLVFVSGLRGTDQNGEPLTDVRVETRRLLDRMSTILGAAGSSLAQAASVSVSLKRAGDFDAMNEVYREYFPKDPPTRTTIVADLMDGALVEMSAVAVPVGAPRQVLHPAGWMTSPRPYSYLVRAGGLVFFSGLVSRRGTDDSWVPGPVALQTKTILNNAGVLLKTAGLKYEDVVAVRVFLADGSNFEAMNDEYRSYFETAPPARATAVAELMSNEAQVEISIIASTTPKQPIGPLVSPTVPVSAGVLAGSRLFLSGVVGNTDANRDDAAAQTREALTRIGRTLGIAGMSFADVVDSTVYLPDISQHAKIDAVFRDVFQKDPPARTVIGTKLVTREAQVEILMTAVK